MIPGARVLSGVIDDEPLAELRIRKTFHHLRSQHLSPSLAERALLGALLVVIGALGMAVLMNSIYPDILARKLGLPQSQYTHFRKTLRELVQQGRIEMGKSHTVRPTKPHGTGLGLALSRQILEAHGGKTTVESRVGVGTTFVVTLPIEPPGAKRRTDHTPAEPMPAAEGGE